MPQFAHVHWSALAAAEVRVQQCVSQSVPDLIQLCSNPTHPLLDVRVQDMRMFLDNFQQEFRYAGTKPHVLFAGRMEGDLMAGCGQKTTSSSGFTIKVGFSQRR